MITTKKPFPSSIFFVFSVRILFVFIYRCGCRFFYLVILFLYIDSHAKWTRIKFKLKWNGFSSRYKWLEHWWAAYTLNLRFFLSLAFLFTSSAPLANASRFNLKIHFNWFRFLHLQLTNAVYLSPVNLIFFVRRIFLLLSWTVNTARYRMECIKRLFFYFWIHSEFILRFSVIFGVFRLYFWVFEKTRDRQMIVYDAWINLSPNQEQSEYNKYTWHRFKSIFLCVFRATRVSSWYLLVFIKCYSEILPI